MAEVVHPVMLRVVGSTGCEKMIGASELEKIGSGESKVGCVGVLLRRKGPILLTRIAIGKGRIDHRRAVNDHAPRIGAKSRSRTIPRSANQQVKRKKVRPPDGQTSDGQCGFFRYCGALGDVVAQPTKPPGLVRRSQPPAVSGQTKRTQRTKRSAGCEPGRIGLEIIEVGNIG